LIIELEELKNSPDKQLEIDFNEYISELDNSVDVTGHLKVKLTLYGVKVVGDVSTSIELTCDRCLNNYEMDINTEINEDYLFGSLVPEGAKEYELKENQFVNELGEQNYIDLTDIVYQSILLEIPPQNLCDIACPGSEEYQILKEETKIDPRLEQFKNISTKQEQDNNN
jgi:uncharacterized protein